MKKCLFFVIVFILQFHFYAVGQEEKCPPLSDIRLQQLFTEAVETYKRHQTGRTVSILSEIIRSEPDFAPAHFLMGLVYIRERSYRPITALNHFEKTLNLCPEIDPYLYFHLGNIYFDNGEFEKAAKMYESFIADIDNIGDDEYFQAVRKYELAIFLHEGYANPVPFNPQIVKGVSSSEDEYLLTVSADDNVALYTRRVQVKDEFSPWDTHVNHKEIFMQSVRLGDNEFDSGEPLPNPFNQLMHEGSPSLTYDNRNMYYTACEFERNYYNCNIMATHYVNDSWIEAKKLGSNINNPDSWESQPSISPDGNTLYFVSDRNGSYDIFVSLKNENGGWGKSFPIGAPINTDGNERAPFFHIDGQTLYFSSDGHPGFGGYDLFFSKKNEDGTWQKPVNLGYPINTAADETGMVVSTDGSTAYFASTRFSDEGTWNVYSFELYEKARPERVLFLTGEVQTNDNESYNDVQLQLRNLETLETRDIEVDTITGKYAVAELFKNDFLLTLKKEDFAYTSRILTVEDSVFKTPAKVDIDLVPVEVGQTYKIQDIYFDYDEYELREESKIVLYTLVEFLIDHPEVRLEVRGHTDNIGGHEYNQTLSENRAKAVYEFLIQNETSHNRLTYKGFGQTKPIDTNDTEEGRANNRRTEFVILDK